MTNDLLSFLDIKGGYGDTEILHGVTGSISPGETLGVFGRNGVGKTTLARLLIGEVPVSAGELVFGGRSVVGMPAHARRKRGVGYMPQTGMLFDNLTVRENLSLSDPGSSLHSYFEIFPRLAERMDQLAGSMSGGERKLLSFVRVMLEDTQLIILDEPSEGVQPENIEKMQGCIRSKQKSGSTFLLVEQNISMLIAVSDKFLGLDAGRTVFEGDAHNYNREDLLSVMAV